MSITDIIQSKEVDIYISLFFTILGLILGVIVDILRKGPAPTINNQQENFLSLTVNNIVNPRQVTPASQADQGLLPAIITCMVVTGIIYLFYREEILNILSWITVFTISLWAGGTMHSLYKGYFSGGAWTISLLFSLVFCIVALSLVDKAFTPNHAPKYFIHSQAIINKYGITGLKDFFDIKDARWFMFHLLGVLALFLAKIRMTLSSTYFLAAGNLSISANSNEPWIIKKTRKYANLKSNIIYVSLLLFISYYLISGDFFMWFEYIMPGRVDQFIDTILHGR